MNKLFKIFPLFLSLILLPSLLLAKPAMAAESSVIFRNQAESFVVSPADKDLFRNFKDIMPGDTRNQTITIGNDAGNRVPVNIYLHAEAVLPEDRDFLSQLKLEVRHSVLGLVSSGSASETGSLTEPVLLGKFAPGQRRSLQVRLDVPIGLANQYQNAAAEIVWVFTAEQIDLPPVPQTGESISFTPLGITLLAAGVVLLLLFHRLRKRAERR